MPVHGGSDGPVDSIQKQPRRKSTLPTHVFKTGGDTIIIALKQIGDCTFSGIQIFFQFLVFFATGTMFDMNNRDAKLPSDSAKHPPEIFRKLFCSRQLKPSPNFLLIQIGFPDGILPQMIGVPRLPAG